MSFFSLLLATKFVSSEYKVLLKHLKDLRAFNTELYDHH